MVQTTFCEYVTVRVTDGLRQGDILESTDQSASPWTRHLIVITADCDFAHEKHHGRVTCVPALRVEKFHHSFTLPKIRDRIALKGIVALQELLSNAEAPAISSNRLRAWIQEVGPDGVVESLDLSEPDAMNAHKHATSVHLALSESSEFQQEIRALVAAQLASPSPPKEQNAVGTVLNSLKSAYRQPPGDALFLSSIGPNLDEGYFVYLRHLEQVAEQEVALTFSRAVTKYRRISRLETKYTHALSQRFALVFMSIGLPDEYEEMRNFYSDLIGDQL